MGGYYFYYLRQTFWYESVMAALQLRESTEDAILPAEKRSIFWRVGRKCWQLSPRFVRRRLVRLKEYLKQKL